VTLAKRAQGDSFPTQIEDQKTRKEKDSSTLEHLSQIGGRTDRYATSGRGKQSRVYHLVSKSKYLSPIQFEQGAMIQAA